jgi:hypothetical protein
MVEALGAGPEFNQRMVEMRADFADLIRRYLDQAVAAEAIPPIDTKTAAAAWFGAINEIITRWALADQPSSRLDEIYPTLRTMLLRGIGAPTDPC